jgi:hypothetical protein
MEAGEIAVSEHHPPVNGWDAHAEAQVRAWMRTAQLNSAINELAALYYTKLHRAALIVVSILTIVVGSSGVATVIAGGASPANVVISVCQIALGLAASLLSNMELKTKSVTFSKRAMGYSRLASVLRVQLVLRPDERQHKADFLQGIPERVEYLDDMAEPLPLRYRGMAEQSATGGIMNMWSGGGGVSVRGAVVLSGGMETTEECARLAAGAAAEGCVAGSTAPHLSRLPYDGGHDEEGGVSAIVRTIMDQRL